MARSGSTPDRKTLNDNTVDIDAYKRIVGSFPSGLAIVTGMTERKPHGMTLQSFMSLSLAPTLVAIGVAKASTTWPKIDSSGSFAVNVLARSQCELARRFAMRATDRFQSLDYGLTRRGNPVIADASAWLDCRVVSKCEAGDHILVVGEVIELMQPRAAGTERPIVYFQSQFHSLTPLV